MREQERKSEVSAFEYMVMMNDFIDNVMPHLKPSEIKMALVTARKTLGWGKRSDYIGRKQFCELANINESAYKDALAGGFCERTGIKMEQGQVCGTLRRRMFTWPKSEGAVVNLERASIALNRGKFPPRQYGANTTVLKGQNPPTQSNSNTLERSAMTHGAAQRVRKRLKESRDSRAGLPIGDDSFYTE